MKSLTIPLSLYRIETMKTHRITIYRYAGKQGLFYIPKDWCEECDLLIALVKDTIKELHFEDKVETKIRPWFLWAWLPFFRYFAWHPPLLIIDGKLISQGIVPRKKQVIDALGC